MGLFSAAMEQLRPEALTDSNDSHICMGDQS